MPTAIAESNPADKIIRVCLLVLAMAVIVHGSVYPWHFDFVHSSHSPFVVLINSWPPCFDLFALSDAIINLTFYFPFGFTLYVLIADNRRPMAAAALTIGASLCLSTSLELLQVYVPGRVCSVSDIICNAAGAAVGALVAATRGRWFRRWTSHLALWTAAPFRLQALFLLACWAGYQLFPLAPQVRMGSLQAEIFFLIHPQSLYPAEIWTTVAEWFAVSLLISLLAGEDWRRWLLGTVCFRIVARPFVLTRLFALDELIGAVLAVCIYFLLPERWRRPAALAFLAIAIVLRQIAPFPLSHLPEYLGPGARWLRSAFDYGATVWLLRSAGVSYLRAGLLILISLFAFDAVHQPRPWVHATATDPVLATIVTLVLWLCRNRCRIPEDTEPTGAYS